MGAQTNMTVRIKNRTLTNTERKILRLVKSGVLTKKELAESLIVAETTVKTHLDKTFRKLEVKSMPELVFTLFTKEIDLEPKKSKAKREEEEIYAY
jgi:DNA-binding CsgD family transcriptional regulator